MGSKLPMELFKHRYSSSSCCCCSSCSSCSSFFFLLLFFLFFLFFFLLLLLQAFVLFLVLFCFLTSLLSSFLSLNNKKEMCKLLKIEVEESSFPISLVTLHAVGKPYGNIQRMILFSKNGEVHALVGE